MSVTNLLENWARYRRDIDSGGYHEYEHMWGMSIDLDTCIGCNACATACYAENNLAVVGKERFERGQSMHWLRVERYWDVSEKNMQGDHPEQGATFTPMMCQQCNAATCEPVCPVAATYHTSDGLNAQIYNRCIGSRYCSNNCPYRNRYFNFYSYAEDSWPEPLHMQLNPDITVRDKGVMEKCTFCFQRIRTAKDLARREERKVNDNDVQTACAQACPTSAIEFGDLLDPDSRVSKIWEKYQVKLNTVEQKKQNPQMRGYRVLEELNTEPCVAYLDRVREQFDDK